MNATQTNTGATETQEAVNNQTEKTTTRQVYLPSSKGVCILSLHLRPENEAAENGFVSLGGSTPGETSLSEKRNRRRTTQKMVRIILFDGKPIDGREARGVDRRGLKVVYVPEGENYNPRKHGKGVRYNKFFHKPVRSVPLEQKVA
jgi:hypothetical protein